MSKVNRARFYCEGCRWGRRRGVCVRVCYSVSLIFHVLFWRFTLQTRHHAITSVSPTVYQAQTQAATRLFLEYQYPQLVKVTSTLPLMTMLPTQRALLSR
jgi:hypothetical protein